MKLMKIVVATAFFSAFMGFVQADDISAFIETQEQLKKLYVKESIKSGVDSADLQEILCKFLSATRDIIKIVSKPSEISVAEREKLFGCAVKKLRDVTSISFVKTEKIEKLINEITLLSELYLESMQKRFEKLHDLSSIITPENLECVDMSLLLGETGQVSTKDTTASLSIRSESDTGANCSVVSSVSSEPSLSVESKKIAFVRALRFASYMKYLEKKRSKWERYTDITVYTGTIAFLMGVFAVLR